MQNAEKNAKEVQVVAAGAKGTNPAKTENRPNIPGKAKNDEPTQNQNPGTAPEAAKANGAEVKTVQPAAGNNQPLNGTAAAEKQELSGSEPKAEVKYIKPVMNLEQTIKTVNDLHRRSIQRLALIARIKLLEDFEVKLVEENDELESNPYQGCKLIIKDDKGRDFTTNTPGLIRMVAQFIFDACHEKLAEIEANIVLPNA